MWKKFLLGLLTAVYLLCSFCVVKAETTKSMDTIILLDTSGSMRASDRTRIAIDAVKLYIDLAQTASSRIGIIAFSDDIVKSIGLTEVNNQEEKELIKSEIDKLAYDGYTDIGMVLAAGAEEISKNMDASANPLIILFTDGIIEMNDKNPNGRTVDDSLADVESVLDYAGGLFPIYTVGLNVNNSVDTDLLGRISERTGASSYITNSAENLPQIFNEIFANFLKTTLVDAGSNTTDGVNYVNFEITIPNSVVTEASIILLTQSQLQEVLITDPNGELREISGDDVSFTSTAKYSTLKLTNPDEGTWTLSLKGSKGNLVKANLICSYLLNLITEFVRPNENGQIDIIAALAKENETITDPEVYKNLTGAIVIESAMGDRYELRMENTGQGFTGIVSEAALDSLASDADIFVKVSGPDYVRESVKRNIPARLPDTPEPTLEPTAEPIAAVSTAIPTIIPTAAPTQTPEAANNEVKNTIDNFFSMLSYPLLAVAAFALLTIFGSAAYFRKKAANMPFNGSVEVKIIDDNGLYAPSEAADLSNFAGSARLSDIIISCMDVAYIFNIDQLLPILNEIVIKPREEGNLPVLTIDNFSTEKIHESNGQVIKKRRYVWRDKICIVIKANDYGVKVELTFKANYMIF